MPFLMTWKVPALGEFRLGITARAARHMRRRRRTDHDAGRRRLIEHGRVGCDHGLAGQTIAIDGLNATMTDVLVRIKTNDGHGAHRPPDPSSPSFTVPVQPGPLMVLSGISASASSTSCRRRPFVIRAVPLAAGARYLPAPETVTAFTLAQSITLAAATLASSRVRPRRSRR